MSEQQIAEALGAINEEAEVLDTQDNDQEEEDTSNLSPVELRAWNQGWRPEDQFEGNPDNWKTAGEYNLYGEMQTQIRDAKAEARRVSADADARIANLNKLHQAQQEAIIADLRNQQRQAVDEADTDRYDKLQDQIDKKQADVGAAYVPPANAKIPQVEEWEKQNPWVMDPNDDRTSEANSFYAIASKKPGATIESCLEFVDAQLAKLHPEMDKRKSNPRREMPSMAETSTQPRSRTRGKDVTMDSLTPSERNDWEKFGKLMFTEKDFLKSVADSRKA